MPPGEVTYTPQYKILQYGEKQFLRLSSLFTLPYQTYEDACFMDITDFVQNRSRQYRYFLASFCNSRRVGCGNVWDIQTFDKICEPSDRINQKNWQR